MKGFVRPKATILDEHALVPGENLITPAPNQFTHELPHAQPYYFTGAQQGRPPDGELPAGAKVVLLAYDGGSYCRVADERGLYVELEYQSLKRLEG